MPLKLCLSAVVLICMSTAVFAGGLCWDVRTQDHRPCGWGPETRSNGDPFIGGSPPPPAIPKPSAKMIADFTNRFDALIREAGNLDLERRTSFTSVADMARSTDHLYRATLESVAWAESRLSGLSEVHDRHAPWVDAMARYASRLEDKEKDAVQALEKSQNLWRAWEKTYGELERRMVWARHAAQHVVKSADAGRKRFFDKAAAFDTAGLPRPSTIRGLPAPRRARYEPPAVKPEQVGKPFQPEPVLTAVGLALVIHPDPPRFSPTAANERAITGRLNEVDKQVGSLRRVNHTIAVTQGNLNGARRRHADLKHSISRREQRLMMLTERRNQALAYAETLKAKGRPIKQVLFANERKLVEKVVETAFWGELESRLEAAASRKFGGIVDVSSFNKFRNVMKAAVKLGEGISAVIEDMPDALAHNQDEIDSLSERIDRTTNEFNVSFAEVLWGAPGWLDDVIKHHWRDE